MEPYATTLAVLLLAAPFVGSFLGTLVLRLPEGRPVVLARSACPACGARLGAGDMLPLLSWLALRGRCRHCGAPVAGFYPAMEIAAPGIVLWAALILPAGEGAALLASAVLGWALLVLALTDRRAFLLPDAVTLPLAGLGLGAAAWLDPPSLLAHAAAAAGGFAAFAGIAAFYRRLRGREGLGLGDAKLLAAAGAWLGPAALPGVVLVAALLGLAEALARRCGGADMAAAPIAFGTWLALATWLAWLHGPLLPG